MLDISAYLLRQRPCPPSLRGRVREAEPPPRLPGALACRSECLLLRRTRRALRNPSSAPDYLLGHVLEDIFPGADREAATEADVALHGHSGDQGPLPGEHLAHHVEPGRAEARHKPALEGVAGLIPDDVRPEHVACASKICLGQFPVDGCLEGGDDVDPILLRPPVEPRDVLDLLVLKCGAGRKKLCPFAQGHGAVRGAAGQREREQQDGQNGQNGSSLHVVFLDLPKGSLFRQGMSPSLPPFLPASLWLAHHERSQGRKADATTGSLSLKRAVYALPSFSMARPAARPRPTPMRSMTP